MELTLPVALHNYDILKHLPEYTRIRVSQADGSMSYETRYFTSARRYLDQSSRTQLTDPLKQTFTLIRNIIDKDEQSATLRCLSIILEKMYRRQDNEIFHVIDTLIENLILVVSPPVMSPVVSPPVMSPAVSPPTTSPISTPQAPPPPYRLTDRKEMEKFQEDFKRYYESRRVPTSISMAPANDFESPEGIRRRRPEDVRIRISPDASEDTEEKTNRCVVITNIIKWFRNILSSD